MRKVFAQSAVWFAMHIAAMFLMGPLMISCNNGSGARQFVPVKVTEPVTIMFASKDGLPVTADVYMAYDEKAPLILLCHRASWSRGEYLEIAPKLNMLGFNAVAIDQRSGAGMNGITNITNKAACEQEKKTTYLESEQDIQAAIEYVSKRYAKGKIILWGSSYSSSLSLMLAKRNKGKLKGCLAFSPGEYFIAPGRPYGWVAENVRDITVPVFITSRKSEESGVRPIFDAIKSVHKTYYVPEYEGEHGSECLFETAEGHGQTWEQVELFLSQFRK